MNRSLLALISVAVLAASVFARCGTDAYLERLYAKTPGLRESLQRRNAEIDTALSRAASEKKKQSTDIYTIPVVFHIIYYNQAQNLDDEIIADQLARLNIDYRRWNDQTETVSSFEDLEADTGIQFIFAETDPDGQATDGITRTQTSTYSFNPEDDLMKFTSSGGHDAWDTTKYMNVWVCNLSGNILGYATIPGSADQARDGVVITTSGFGAGDNAMANYNLGRTLTHEAGHWFNLRHPWGNYEGDCNEDDYVTDTPQTIGPNDGCDLQASSCANLNMVQNYMDYTVDSCMTLFTVGQVARMRFEVGSGGGRRSAVIVNYGGEILGEGDYVSPFGPDGGSTDGGSTNGDSTGGDPTDGDPTDGDPEDGDGNDGDGGDSEDQTSDSGGFVTSFLSKPYLFVLIAVCVCSSI
eukprot:TRINITY_DN2394_c0_g1_i1.p1 TRINITY_DN2394_c0_g1~~TRINITY_DN2394_c0_g1_i1.p1  ORF type:complete len:410 (+),score=63.85 TRINITY_DN2394_c0_g1_i1:1-1230(+)